MRFRVWVWVGLLGACAADGTVDGGARVSDAGSRQMDSGSPADAGQDDADAARPDAGDGWIELFNGVDLEGISLVVTTEDEIQIADGVLTCGTGPFGYWYTEASYENYVLELELRYTRPADLAVGDDERFDGNSGLLMHIQGEHRVWPACVEVQGMNRDLGQIFSIGGAPGVVARQDVEARRAATNPVGEWNTLRVVSRDGAFEVELNGTPVADSDPGPLTSGPIGFQCEGAEISWRHVRLMPLP